MRCQRAVQARSEISDRFISACGVSSEFLRRQAGRLVASGKLGPRVTLRHHRGETVEVQRMPPDDACAADMLVLIRRPNRTMAVPLSQLVAINPDQSTAEAIGDWHYWVAQGRF
jgi:hypothetical protein